MLFDNRTGASEKIGTTSDTKAEADSYKIVVAAVGPLTISHSYQRQLTYEPIKGLAPISQVAVLPCLLVVHPSVPARHVAELIALAKAKPRALNYASAGPATLAHLSGALFEKMADVSMVHVPYRGGAPAVADTVAGQTQLFFTAGIHQEADGLFGMIQAM